MVKSAKVDQTKILGALHDSKIFQKITGTVGFSKATKQALKATKPHDFFVDSYVGGFGSAPRSFSTAGMGSVPAKGYNEILKGAMQKSHAKTDRYAKQFFGKPRRKLVVPAYVDRHKVVAHLKKDLNKIFEPIGDFKALTARPLLDSKALKDFKGGYVPGSEYSGGFGGMPRLTSSSGLETIPSKGHGEARTVGRDFHKKVAQHERKLLTKKRPTHVPEVEGRSVALAKKVHPAPKKAIAPSLGIHYPSPFLGNSDPTVVYLSRRSS